MNAKRLIAEGMWQQGPFLLVFLDPRAAGVVVPSSLRTLSQVSLRFTADSPPQFDSTGIAAYLEFDDEAAPFAVVVPWTAIYLLVTETGSMCFADAMPAELAQEIQESQQEDVQQAVVNGPLALRRRPRPAWLSVVP